FIDFSPVKSYPKPVQKPHPPILLGGAAKNVLQRVVAYGNGWMPTRMSPERLQENRNRLNELATAAGRDPATLPIRAFGAPNDALEREPRAFSLHRPHPGREGGRERGNPPPPLRARQGRGAPSVARPRLPPPPPPRGGGGGGGGDPEGAKIPEPAYAPHPHL